MMKIKLACFITLLILFFNLPTANGQADSTNNAQADSTNTVYGFFAIVPVEFPLLDNSKLNRELGAYGFPEAQSRKALLGLGFQWFSDRNIMMLAFNWGALKREQANSRTEVRYSSFSFNFGYDLLRHPLLSLYPYAGLKSCRLNYLYRETTPDTLPLGTYLATDLKYKEFQNSRMHLDLGIGISHQWSYLVTFRFGYLLPLQRTQWRMRDISTQLTHSPAVTYRYYFSLIIGFGGLSLDRQPPPIFRKR